MFLAALRRLRLALLAAVPAVALLACGGDAPGRRPDVFLIVCDTLRADALLDPEGRYETPNLDALARDGVVFTRAFAHAPMTLPSHTSLFSSRLPLETSVWNNHEDVPDDLPLLAEWLQEHGYRTRAVVSIGTLYLGRQRPGLSRGFEHYDVDFWRMARGEESAGRIAQSLAQSPRDEPLFFFAHYADPHEPYDSHGVERREAELFLDGQLLDTLSTSESSKWLRSLELAPGKHELALRSRDPFRVRSFDVRRGKEDLAVDWGGGKPLDSTRNLRLTFEVAGEVAGEAGDVASPAPAKHDVRLWVSDVPDHDEKLARYAREVAYVDRAIGQLLDELKNGGRYDDALIVFTSDHGEPLGEHGLYGHPESLADAHIHVPLIVKLPRGDARAGELAAQSERVTPQLDLAPTLLELLDLPPLPGARGSSLLTPHDSVIVSETHRPEAKRDQIALRDERYKMVFFPEEERFELYDLERDPGELHDVFAAEPDARAEWPERLRTLARAGADKKRRGPATELDEATRRDLEALGYLGGDGEDE